MERSLCVLAGSIDREVVQEIKREAAKLAASLASEVAMPKLKLYSEAAKRARDALENLAKAETLARNLCAPVSFHIKKEERIREIATFMAFDIKVAEWVRRNINHRYPQEKRKAIFMMAEYINAARKAGWPSLLEDLSEMYGLWSVISAGLWRGRDPRDDRNVSAKKVDGETKYFREHGVTRVMYDDRFVKVNRWMSYNQFINRYGVPFHIEWDTETVDITDEVREFEEHIEKVARQRPVIFPDEMPPIRADTPFAPDHFPADIIANVDENGSWTGIDHSPKHGSEN